MAFGCKCCREFPQHTNIVPSIISGGVSVFFKLASPIF